MLLTGSACAVRLQEPDWDVARQGSARRCLLPSSQPRRACPSHINPAAAEKSLAEYRDRLPQNVIDEINNAVADVRGVMESENPEASTEWWFVVRIG